jgi:acyl-CoA reductase-like NAD-dependent aldehyde dehydrogenase
MTILKPERNSKILGKKLSVPILAIHPITSLDDAIDFANNTNHPLLASYIFADPPAAKYLNQFIDAHLSLVNHIPVDLLGKYFLLL